MVARPAAATKPLSRAADRVHVHGFAVHGVHAGSLESFADLLGNPAGVQVARGDPPDDTGERRSRPAPAQRGGGRLGGEAEAPSRTVDDPAEIDTRPGS